MKVSMAIAIEDRKQGDIIAIKPAGWKWGTEEVKHFLIVEVDLGLIITTIEDAQKLIAPVFEDGALWSRGEDLNGNSLDSPIINKRRYKLPFTDIDNIVTLSSKTINWTLVKSALSYQPIEKFTLPFSSVIYDKVLKSKLTNSNLILIRDANK